MQPYDGSGHGKSTYWTWQLACISANNGEACPCWKDNKPNLEFTENNLFTIKISCVAKTAFCKTSFAQTEKELKIRFENFYKV